MYLKKAVYENVGPLRSVSIDFPFNEKGTQPKPIVLVGENGSGKSTFLSNIVDSLYMMAGVKYENAQLKDEGGIGTQGRFVLLQYFEHTG